MKPLVKSAVESALIAALAAVACLWFMISAGMADEGGNEAKVVLLALGLTASLVAHWTYMGLALKRDGRPLLGWMVGLVLLFPIVTIVALVLMSARDEEEGKGRGGSQAA
ncbi:hypothetical protein G8A07_22515 [Roseateles sp. DAIF2]|uniref:hypothetical protein n=1 Tax=Roseateles sp. DAIF2 TaxID=2714952 RepID=UPI0018A28E99|nr:hypothetical protein [Roseateles sp. DAIF2]QPF75418.1 hypothetical protein G8A07_22515 [Roseateles sp. DAIF2]